MVQIAKRRFLGTSPSRGSVFVEAGDEIPSDLDPVDPNLIVEAGSVEVQQGPSDEGESDPDGVDLSGFDDLKTISQITAWVDMATSDPERAARARHALQAEQDGGQRRGLVEELTAVLTAIEGEG